MLRKIRIILEMIKYQHSIHVLPFVYLGAFLAHKSFPGWEKLGWITLGMVSARALALALNRYIDRNIDQMNPRTSMRALPSGILGEKECLIFCGITAGLCILSAYHLPPRIWLMLPLVFALFIFYPFTKRFTWTCHLWLGLTMGLAPLGGWLAVSGEITPAAIYLMLAVFFLISGSDIIYTMQDVEVDWSQGLFSIPARLGITKAIKLARWGHFLCFVFLLLAGNYLNLNNMYYAGIIFAAVFTVYQNRLVPSARLAEANEVFLATNAFVSLVVLLFTLASLGIHTHLV